MSWRRDVKRIAAIVLVDLALELVRLDDLVDGDGPFAVIVDDEELGSDGITDNKSALLDAVDCKAWKYGARPGQSAAQASAYVGQLQVIRITRERVRQALGCVAEMALGFGTSAALDLSDHKHEEQPSLARYPAGAGAGPQDTVWLDVTGCSKLVGGDDLLCADLRERARRLGHRARVAIASGPRIAQAVARWATPTIAMYGSSREMVVPAGDDAAHLSELPIAALPLSGDVGAWFLKLGLLNIDDLRRLDRKRLFHRLGNNAADLIGLIEGRDGVPLCAYAPPRNIIESSSFEHEIRGTEPLLFVLRGLTSRAIARLCARGEACTMASMVMGFDRSFIALQQRQGNLALQNEQRIELELPVPLAGEEELLRALRAKLERTELPAPVLSVSLILDGLTSKPQHQLDLGRKGNADPHALPNLLAELSATVGPTRIGVLALNDSHRPEAQSRLVPVDPKVSSKAPSKTQNKTKAESKKQRLASLLMPEPTRILPTPIPIGSLSPGALVNADHTLFLIDRLRLSARIDRVEWWSAAPVCRDYARAWLRTHLKRQGPAHLGPRDHTELGEAWVYVDRQTRQAFLQGWYE